MPTISLRNCSFIMCRKWKVSTDISEKEIRVLETEITHFVNINIPGMIFSVVLELSPP